MKNNTHKLVSLFIIFLLAAAVTYSQHKPDTTKMHSQKNMMHHSMKDSSKHSQMDHSKMMKEGESDIVRKGEIDLDAIDKNKDGMVFQDQMDWNVISDEPGKCPICGMTLKEVEKNKAKVNLISNGYKVK